jgi:hypothetical protein
MKKVLFIVLSLFSIITPLFGNQYNKENISNNSINYYNPLQFYISNHIKPINSDDVKLYTYKQFLIDNLPNIFIESFYELTKDDIDLGIELIGLGDHESEWKYFISNINHDNTYDHGPLQLNESNLNDNFINKYNNFPDEYKQNTMIYYMCLCINFYKSLRETNSLRGALMQYNGGPKAYTALQHTQLYKKTQRYQLVVKQKIQIRIDQFDYYLSKNYLNNELILKQIEYQRVLKEYQNFNFYNSTNDKKVIYDINNLVYLFNADILLYKNDLTHGMIIDNLNFQIQQKLIDLKVLYKNILI